MTRSRPSSRRPPSAASSPTPATATCRRAADRPPAPARRRPAQPLLGRGPRRRRQQRRRQPPPARRTQATRPDGAGRARVHALLGGGGEGFGDARDARQYTLRLRRRLVRHIGTAATTGAVGPKTLRAQKVQQQRPPHDQHEPVEQATPPPPPPRALPSRHLAGRGPRVDGPRAAPRRRPRDEPARVPGRARTAGAGPDAAAVPGPPAAGARADRRADAGAAAGRAERRGRAGLLDAAGAASSGDFGRRGRGRGGCGNVWDAGGGWGRGSLS
ncbi:hypothetical protein PG994_004954 [Apiospora phragmitis]|uniref:Peptidoglycan binding-like domain-containing protein n=1 Tax=Apiospora phragmitis TaxID=2905665 RepID=A0ABR1VS22_9PEZI